MIILVVSNISYENSSVNTLYSQFGGFGHRLQAARARRAEAERLLTDKTAAAEEAAAVTLAKSEVRKRWPTRRPR
jgi:hypothetical protein